MEEIVERGWLRAVASFQNAISKIERDKFSAKEGIVYLLGKLSGCSGMRLQQQQLRE